MLIAGHPPKRAAKLITQPDLVTDELVQQAVAAAAAKRPLPAAGRVRLERFCEGRVAQVLHRGPFSAEGPTIERLHGFIAKQGLPGAASITRST